MRLTPNQRYYGTGLLILVCLVGAVSLARTLYWKQRPPLLLEKIKGPPDAPITLLEFSDFQCPACRAAQKPLQQILKNYGERIRIVFKHFPLERIHPWARSAAIAAECAHRQGRFWGYHDLLFENQTAWSSSRSGDFLSNYALQLGMDGPRFESCLQDPTADRKVTREAAEARARRIHSTPTFLLNGQPLVGGRQLLERGPQLIERILKVRGGG
ncbi:MAG: thioredoxin domain-containing protein [Elusimicrobia bacterium]|nr:thioredoxin domain-containing protein [Elusimicrobiota bacterium]